MSEPAWVPLGAIATPKAVYPIDFRNASVVASPGLAYPVVSPFTNWEAWSWGFSPNATGFVYGVFRYPENAPGAGTATLRFDLHAAQAGNVVVQVWLKGIADGESFDFSTWDFTSAQDTVTLAAKTRKVHSVGPITIPTHIAPGEIGVVVLGRLPTLAADVNASALELLYGALVIS